MTDTTKAGTKRWSSSKELQLRVTWTSGKGPKLRAFSDYNPGEYRRGPSEKCYFKKIGILTSNYRSFACSHRQSRMQKMSWQKKETMATNTLCFATLMKQPVSPNVNSDASVRSIYVCHTGRHKLSLCSLCFASWWSWGGYDFSYYCFHVHADLCWTGHFSTLLSRKTVAVLFVFLLICG